METVRMLNAGRFVSRGRGRHGTRVIDSYELIYVDAGKLEMFEAGRTFRLSAGEWLLLRPGRRHGGLAAYEPQLVFYWGHFVPRGAEGGARLEAMPSSGRSGRPGRFGEYYRLLLSELRESGPGPGADLLAELLLLEAGRRSEGKEEKAASGLAERIEMGHLRDSHTATSSWYGHYITFPYK